MKVKRLLVALFLFMLAEPDRALAQPVQKESHAERFFSLKGVPENPNPFSWFGTGAEKYVRFEPEGLRITFPAGYPGERPFTGVRVAAPLKGDFTVTVNFEVLQEPKPEEVGKGATRLILVALLNEEQGGGHAGLARRVAPKGTQFSTYVVGGGFKAMPTEAKQGRLRMTRTGADISFYEAEGKAEMFTFLNKLPFKDHDLMRIKLVGVTSSPEAALDVRFSDLRIRGGPSRDVVGADKGKVDEGQADQGGNGWKIILVLFIVLALLAGLLIGVWLSRRRREPNEAEK
jgi:hypothetical protein